MKLRYALNRYLRHSGMSVSTLAQRSGLPKGTLQGWCLGKTPRNMEQVRKLSKFIGVSLDSLLFDEADYETIKIASDQLEGFTVDSDGWHRGTLEVRFRHVPGQARKN